ncbi:MAG: hypothetical protein KDA41_02660, partial [Planctomycetales bacterium]|nr:hypothetical protein [Planctomycetales bacterium]
MSQAQPPQRPAPAAAPAAGQRTHFLLFNAMPSWMVSMVFHIVLLMLLALLTFGVDGEKLLNEFTMNADDDNIEEIRELEKVEFTDIDVVPTEIDTTTELTPVDTEIQTPEPVEVEANDLDRVPAKIEFNLPDVMSMPYSPADTGLVVCGSASDLDGRSSAEVRLQLAKINGGSEESEAAVALALKWIVSRQAADGGWNFNHNLSMNPVPCPDPGSADKARNGATAMALLPLFGAGQTHKV